MKALKSILLVGVLFIGTSVFAQTTVPDAITQKVKAMQEQITKDLQLTPKQSETYFNCEIEKYKLRVEKIKPEMTPEEKKEARNQIRIAIREKLVVAFPKQEMIDKINKWNADNEKKFDNIK